MNQLQTHKTEDKGFDPEEAAAFIHRKMDEADSTNEVGRDIREMMLNYALSSAREENIPIEQAYREALRREKHVGIGHRIEAQIAAHFIKISEDMGRCLPVSQPQNRRVRWWIIGTVLLVVAYNATGFFALLAYLSVFVFLVAAFVHKMLYQE